MNRDRDDGMELRQVGIGSDRFRSSHRTREATPLAAGDRWELARRSMVAAGFGAVIDARGRGCLDRH
jgi:hypothetical protein